MPSTEEAAAAQANAVAARRDWVLIVGAGGRGGGREGWKNEWAFPFDVRMWRGVGSSGGWEFGRNSMAGTSGQVRI